MLKTVLESYNGKTVVEIPDSITNLYSLKEGTKFVIKAKEVGDHLLINMMTKIIDTE